jgi:hypothetical protein
VENRLNSELAETQNTADPESVARHRRENEAVLAAYRAAESQEEDATWQAPGKPRAGGTPAPQSHFLTRHVHSLVYHTAHIHKETKEEEIAEDQSWEGASPKPAPVGAKALLASLFVVFTTYVVFDGWSEFDPSDFEFKLFSFLLSIGLTMPQIYQTTLVTLTFFSLGQDQVYRELQHRRPPLRVLSIAAALTLTLPVTLPVLFLGALFRIDMGFKNSWLVFVGLVDFVQTLVLLPLGYVVIFSADDPSFVLVNMVAAQVFATLDDEVVSGFNDPLKFKLEALETYCEKDPAMENEEEKKEEEEDEEWEGTSARTAPLVIKGLLASCFSIMSFYVVFANWSDVDTDEMHMFKTLMYMLLVVLLLPALYQTTLITLTFIAVSDGRIVEELKQRRPVYYVMCMGIGIFLTLPVVLPALVFLHPFLKAPLRRMGIYDYWLLVVGLIDCMQTIVMFPLGFVMIFTSDAVTDIFIVTTVALVYAGLDDEFVVAFLDPHGFKREALETYCQKAKTAEAKAVL